MKYIQVVFIRMPLDGARSAEVVNSEGSQTSRAYAVFIVRDEIDRFRKIFMHLVYVVALTFLTSVIYDISTLTMLRPCIEPAIFLIFRWNFPNICIRYKEMIR